MEIGFPKRTSNSSRSDNFPLFCITDLFQQNGPTIHHSRNNSGYLLSHHIHLGTISIPHGSNQECFHCDSTRAAAVLHQVLRRRGTTRWGLPIGLPGGWIQSSTGEYNFHIFIHINFIHHHHTSRHNFASFASFYIKTVTQ